MSLIILSIVVIVLVIGYRYYSLQKANREVEPSWSRSTPSRRYLDGEDFIPTHPSVLVGFQFKSISLDVIIGPVIAIQFGWLPAILWLLVGAIFFGWVQDYLSTIMSMRNLGNSLGDLIASSFKPRSRYLILLFLLLYLLIILGQFVMVLSTLLGKENVASGIFFLVLAGLLVGQLIYRSHINLALVTFVSVLIALLGILVSSAPFAQVLITSFNQLISRDSVVFKNLSLASGDLTWNSFIWILILLGICYLGAVLPIWRFAVPLNFISSWIVLFGMVLAVSGLIIGVISGKVQPDFEIPAFVTTFQPNLGPIWPILFVTLASGAISGWHALVSTFSTSRQVEKEPLALPITTGAMFTETVLVAIVIIIAATFGVSAGTFNSEHNYILAAGPASAFASGMGITLSMVGLPESWGGSFSALLLTLMGLTVLQLVLRFARMVSADLLKNWIPALGKLHLSTLLVVSLTLVIIIFGLWQWLWVLFAGVNQLLAGIVLLLASSWLVKQGKTYQWTLWPALFLLLTSFAALFYSSIYQTLYQQIISGQTNELASFAGNLFIVIFGLFFMYFGLVIGYDGWQNIKRSRAKKI
jgi:carbon starvation protein